MNRNYNRMNPETIFGFRRFTEEEQEKSNTITNYLIQTYKEVLDIRDSTAREEALTKLEEVRMWVNKAIYANGLFNTPSRNTDAEDAMDYVVGWFSTIL